MATRAGWRPYILPVLILTTMKENLLMYIIFWINFHLIKNIVTAFSVSAGTEFLGVIDDPLYEI